MVEAALETSPSYSLGAASDLAIPTQAPITTVMYMERTGMDEQHTLELVAHIDGWRYLQCPECGKAIRFHLSDGFEVMNVGDFYARHSWTQGMSIQVEAE